MLKGLFGIYVWVFIQYNGRVFYTTCTVQWEWLFYFMYLFIKCVHIVFILSGHNQKNDVFNTVGDEKGKLDKIEIFSYKSVILST